MRARVRGSMGAGAWAAMPIGALVTGVVIDHVGLTSALVVLGSAYLLVVLSPLLGGPWRDMGSPAVDTGDGRPQAMRDAVPEPSHAS